ncbi:hypothetical protein AB0G73_10520 [Streptomyces sp. NPDC020719]|uniref:hypothetical protein n=1 Tax=Streptomyces sp. NPDC020719 TaxID=3154896 RepID=UPI0033FF8F1E
MTDTNTDKRPARRPVPTSAILSDVRSARKELGEETRPLGGGLRPERARLYYTREAERWANIASARALADHPGWDAELLAELNAAIGSNDVNTARAGLVQVAALAVAAVEQLDREAP